MKHSFHVQLLLGFALVLTMTACSSVPVETLSQSNDPLSNESSSYRVVREDFLNAVHLMEVYPDGSEELTLATVLERWKADGYNFNTTYAVSPDDTRVVYTRYNVEEATAEIYLNYFSGEMDETIVHSQPIELSDPLNQIDDLQWLDFDTVQFQIQGETVAVQVN